MARQPELTWDQPARDWKAAAPLGNGHLGAMVYGLIGGERIDLSELTFFSGRASEHNHTPGAPEAFRRARAAALMDRWDECRDHLQAFVGRRNDYGTNLPVGRLVLTPTGSHHAEATDYLRSLDLSRAIAVTEYNRGGVHFRRQVLASHPLRVLAIRFEASAPILDLNLVFEDAQAAVSCTGDAGDLVWATQALESLHSDGTCGVRLAGRLRVVVREGTCGVEDGVLRVKGAAELTAYLALETDWGSVSDPEDTARRRLDKACALGWDAVVDTHLDEHRRLFDRVSLTLGPSSEAVQAALLFHFGRYLLISSSRSDSRLPAPLQGAWNDAVASRIGWTCDMHLDVNTQMNYWLAEIAGLSECTDPLLVWMEDSLIPAGRECARQSYGLDGWVAELVSNAWGYAAPYWHTNLSPCPTGGAWLLTQFWERYLFSGDREFLADRLYPLVREAVQFFVEYVFEDNKGRLATGPSISPENHFVPAPGSQAFAASLSPRYEVVVIRELYRIFLRASTDLGIADALTARVAEQERRLPDDRLAPDGYVAEWDHDHPAADPQHRHTSHLLGLFPFAQIDPERTPTLARAAAQTLTSRTKPAESWEDTGWARSMLLLYSARLKDAPLWLSHWEALIAGLLNPNFMIKHPPTRGAPAFDDVYELDGNTGAATAVAEALVQSHGDFVDLLPALPPAWSEGSVTGLRARGGLTLALHWGQSRGLVLSATADRAGRFEFRFYGTSVGAVLSAGETKTIVFSRPNDR